MIEKYGDEWIKPGKIVNNGAYVLEDWRINDRIRLRKNPYYWNAKKVALETIEVLPIEKDTVAFNFYASGLADLSMDKGLVPPALLDDIKTREDFHAAPFLGIYFLRFNCSKAPFDDLRVRKAFSMAIDKKRIVEKITRAGELPATAFVPPGLPGYVSPEALAYNPEEARRLLAGSGVSRRGGEISAGDVFIRREGFERGDRRGAPGHVAEGTGRGGESRAAGSGRCT